MNPHAKHRRWASLVGPLCSRHRTVALESHQRVHAANPRQGLDRDSTKIVVTMQRGSRALPQSSRFRYATMSASSCLVRTISPPLAMLKKTA
jgi:hypothetical protein